MSSFYKIILIAIVVLSAINNKVLGKVNGPVDKSSYEKCGLISPVGRPVHDINSVEPDLVVPEMIISKPAKGIRAKQTTPVYKRTEVYHTLNLPSDWEPGRKYNLIGEYAGNNLNSSLTKRDLTFFSPDGFMKILISK